MRLLCSGAPVTGYKMLLQLVASQWPNVAVKDLTKATDLRASYQNRQAIGCSIMWALGQAGFKDLSVGLASKLGQYSSRDPVNMIDS